MNREIFNFDSEEKPIIMAKDEFVSKTKALLEFIALSHSRCHSQTPLKDSEYPLDVICSGCKGEGTFFDENGNELSCYQNYERGCCTKVHFAAEILGDEIDSVINDVYELLCVDQVENNQNEN